jgi:hypothetical protein
MGVHALSGAEVSGAFPTYRREGRVFGSRADRRPRVLLGQVGERAPVSRATSGRRVDEHIRSRPYPCHTEE